MKGTKSLVVISGLFELNILSDHINDVSARLDFIYDIFGNFQRRLRALGMFFGEL